MRSNSRPDKEGWDPNPRIKTARHSWCASCHQSVSTECPASYRWTVSGWLNEEPQHVIKYKNRTKAIMASPHRTNGKTENCPNFQQLISEHGANIYGWRATVFTRIIARDVYFKHNLINPICTSESSSLICFFNSSSSYSFQFWRHGPSVLNTVCSISSLKNSLTCRP